jgi:type I restriction enzyme R subunit
MSAGASEEQSRKHIDAQLAAAGWVVQDVAEINLSVSHGVAVREFRSQGGPADYILFVDGNALGVVEAKKEGSTLSSVAEQSERYSHAKKWVLQGWADPMPFPYETAGVETNFRDQRDSNSNTNSRPVFAFHTLEHLLELVQQNHTLRSLLQALPGDYPLTQGRLHDRQVSAITCLEKSLAGNGPRALLQIATGSGKIYATVQDEEQAIAKT